MFSAHGKKLPVPGPINQMLVINQSKPSSQTLVWTCGTDGIAIWHANGFNIKLEKRLKRHTSPVELMEKIEVLENLRTVTSNVWTVSSDNDVGNIIIFDSETWECKKHFELNSPAKSITFHDGVVWIGTFEFILGFDPKVLSLSLQFLESFLSNRSNWRNPSPF